MRSLVVDPSAAVAVLLAEPGAADLRAAMADADRLVMSAASVVELGIVLEARFGAPGRGLVDRFLRDARVEVVPVDAAAVDLALDGWRRYGRGRHIAALNYGDCFTYGLAIGLGAAVLCTGEDFARTDVAVVTPDAGLT